jgi:hypothetical protein
MARTIEAELAATNSFSSFIEVDTYIAVKCIARRKLKDSQKDYVCSASSVVPSGLGLFADTVPSVETPGYFQAVPSGRGKKAAGIRTNAAQDAKATGTMPANERGQSDNVG